MSVERDPRAPEIRAWGAENGWDIKEHGRIPAGLRSAWATANAGGAAQLRDSAVTGNGHAANGAAVTFSVPDYVPDAVGDHIGDLADSLPTYLPGPDERPPEEPPRRSRREEFMDRLRSRPKPPPGRRRRVSLELFGGLVWTGGAQLAARRGRFLPVANIMALQAPVAGLVADDALKNTAADALLQPIARALEAGGTVGSLLGPPALVGLVCARPELYPVARPMLVMAMKEWIITAGPKLRELKRREEKFAAEMAELSGEGEDGENEYAMSIDDMLDMVFAPLFNPTGPDAMRSTPGDADAAAGA